MAAAAASGFGWFLAGLIPLIAERTRAGASTVGAVLGGGAGPFMGLSAIMVRGAPIASDGSILTSLLALGCRSGWRLCRRCRRVACKRLDQQIQ